jgi:NAD+ kinase
MKSIGIICKWGRSEPQEILEELLPWLSERGVKAYCDPSIKCCSGAKPELCSVEEMPSLVDMGVVLGGDGTMLWAARMFSPKGTPLLGVNLGGMGFITEVARKDAIKAMERVLEGDYTIEQRIMLSAVHSKDAKPYNTFQALNDVVVSKGNRATIIELEVLVNGVFVTRYRSDGIIVATPTGSTAYTLSSGGPIIYPTLNCLVLTPICPHTLTNRPIVLPDDSTVEIRLISDSDDMVLTHDGLVAGTLARGDEVIISRSEHTASMIMPPGHDHFEALRTKLGWGER